MADDRDKYKDTEKLINEPLKRDFVAIDILSGQNDEESFDSIYNDWTEDNYETVKRWQKHSARMSDIYDAILEKYKTRVGMVVIFGLIFSSLATLVAGISSALLAMNQVQYIWIIFGFNIAILVLVFLTTILSGLIAITKWDSYIMDLTKHVERLQNFYIRVTNQINLPKKCRVQAESFIQIVGMDYQYVNMIAPDLFSSDLLNANKKYETFLRKKNNAKNYSKYMQDNV